MRDLSFFLRCDPPTSTHHSKKIVHVGGHARMADRPGLVSAKQLLDTLLLQHRPEEPFRGPVVLDLRFYFPWLSKHGKRVRAGGAIPKTTKPDCSNLAKTIEDRLVKLNFIEDDNAVFNLAVAKYHFGDTGIAVKIISRE